jgi:hypothetical protein
VHGIAAIALPEDERVTAVAAIQNVVAAAAGKNVVTGIAS